ncbi:MAG: polysaccharide ABC transporter ATP-binding protein [Robiginitomaculum sp.]|nr:polysaccharide ABC transporter ATP-binding protein [Robiginitomaculum sp.]
MPNKSSTKTPKKPVVKAKKSKVLVADALPKDLAIKSSSLPVGEELALQISQVSKAYGTLFDLSFANLWKFLKTRKISSFRSSKATFALDGIDLEVRKGELMGIIGRNGAGKSTLLKVISGVSASSKGDIKINGSVFPMIELNAGMNPSFTGRENVRLLATIMGMSKKEIDKRMPEIQEFCDLGKWFDRPVRQYSKGMPGRLGFAVAVHADAEILLIDEVLAVGDINFREACSLKMQELRDEGKTVVLVSHNMTAITHLCSRAAFIEQGKVEYIGPSEMAVKRYTEFMRNISLRKLQKSLKSSAAVEQQEGFVLSNVEIADVLGQSGAALNSEHGLQIAFDYVTPADFKQGTAFVRLFNQDGVKVLSELCEMRIAKKPDELRRVAFNFSKGIPLPSGRYTLQVGITGSYSDSGEMAIGEREFTVINARRLGEGVVSCAFKVQQASVDQFEALKEKEKIKKKA